MKNVILTGATGFVGRYVLKQLIEDGYNVTAIIRSKDKEKEILEFVGLYNAVKDFNFAFVESSLEDIDKKVFANIEYYAWIHLAWGGINRKEINDVHIHEQNYNNSVKCLEIAKELNCVKFIETGSRAECGNEDTIIPEGMSGEPLNTYGKYKRLFYEFAYDFCKKSNIEYLHLRLFAVTGPGDHPWSLVSECCRKFSHNETMEFGSCEQIWNYLDVREAAKVIVSFIELNILSIEDNRIINIAAKSSRPLKEYIYFIHKRLKSSSKLYFSDNRGFDSNPVVFKMNKYCNLSNDISFENTIEDMLNSQKDI